MRDRFKIGDRWVGKGEPTYFIAEVGANFDKSLTKAKRLVEAAAASRADAVKFQSFRAKTLVSDVSFSNLKLGYQSSWDRSVFEVYEDAEFPLDWQAEVADHAKAHGLHFLLSCWDDEALRFAEDELKVVAHKVGSGDLNWTAQLQKTAEFQKPVLLATGASTLWEVAQAVDAVRRTGNESLALLQCVTHYPSKLESANVTVLNTYASAFGVATGYSDHAPGDEVVLAAVARGGSIIEKHFTLDRTSQGPDHGHSLEPAEFRVMVERSETVRRILGDGYKDVAAEEKDSVVIMRRSLHASRPIARGEKFSPDNLICLRPAVGVPPSALQQVCETVAAQDIAVGEPIKWSDLTGTLTS